jgi:ATP-dependent RNA helicase CshB
MNLKVNNMKFSSYNLKNDLLQALNELGYTDLTPVQEATLAKALKGKSLICKSETGSGKTHAFLIPLINNLNRKSNNVQVIIVSPTVILANQTYNFAKKLVSKLEGNLNVKLLTSTSNKTDDLVINDNEVASQIVIGTPGRLKDILIKNKVDMQDLQALVLDEADMLLDPVYEEDLNALLDLKPYQKLVFTATMKEHELAHIKKAFGVPEIVEVNKNKTNKNVKHHLVDIKHKDIVEQLVKFLDVVKPYFTIVFSSKKTQIEKVYRELNNRGITCALITGSQEQRDTKITLRRIKNGEFNLVLASDIASRGLDLEDVSTVISLDLPVDLDYYYHRSGRAGRNNKTGDSYIFFNDDDMNQVNKLKEKIDFDSLALKADGLTPVRKKAKVGQKKSESDALQREIRKNLAKLKKNDKVKPGYKKKRKIAIEKAKVYHKRRMIKKNIAQQKKINEAKGGYGRQ